MYKIYCLKKNYEIVYVGRTNNIKKRIYDHHYKGLKDFDSFEILKEVECINRAKKIEDLMIKKFDPIYNKSNNEYGAYISFEEIMKKLNKSENELDEMLYKKRIKPIFNDNYKLSTLDILKEKDFSKMFRKKVI